jgi:hypothetical protein
MEWLWSGKLERGSPVRKKKLLKEKIAVMIISVVMLIALLMLANALDPIVHFADSGLEEAVRDKLRKPLNKSNLLTITELDASGRRIKNLEGIENLRKLVSINLDDNFVEDLSPLAQLEMLTELSLRNNEITDLNVINFAAITNLPLRKLNLRHNVIRSPGGKQVRLSDISLLKHLSHLEELDLRDNHIADIAPLSGLIKLNELDLRENHLVGIAPLGNLTSLKKLNLRENYITDITPLEGLQNLVYLNIHSNENIESIEPLSKLVNLQTLIMRNVPVGYQVIFFRDLHSLKYLNIRNCGIEDLGVIGELMSIGVLQDNDDAGIEATVDIRNNPLYITDSDHYDPIRAYWDNVANRRPLELISVLQPPVFSHAGGFYDDNVLLELTTSVPGAVIYYTLDGSKPSPDNLDGILYTYKNQYSLNPGDPPGEFLSRICRTLTYSGPITLTGGYAGFDSIAMINTTNSSAIPKPTGNIKIGAVVRAVTYKDGYPISPIVTQSYLIGRGINDYYHLPIVSVTAEEQDLFDYQSGIYVAGKAFDDWREQNPSESIPYFQTPANYQNRGVEWEKEVNLEIFAPSGELLLNQLTGMRIHGGAARARPNKSLRFYARNDYGYNRFNIKLFENKNLNQFKRFILRNSGNDTNSTMFRDALLQSLVKDLRLDSQDYQPVLLFVNGVYWGIFNIRDRIDRFYLFYEHGVNPEKVDLLTGNAVVEEGGNNHYLSMLEFIKANNVKDISIYEHINTLMDIDNFINYYSSQIYFANTDWPAGNLIYWRLQTDQYEPNAPHGHDGRWRWILYDLDFGFGLYDSSGAYTHNTLAYSTEEESLFYKNPDWSTFLIRALLENEQFKVDFINRFADHLNTIFLPEVVVAKIDAMQANIAPLMQEHIDRWGQPQSLEIWEENVEVMRVFARNRPEALRGHIIEYFDLNGTVKVNLSTDFSKGTIIINTIDVGYYLPNNDFTEYWSGNYFIGVPISITAVPKPGYTFSEWKEAGIKNETLKLDLTEDLTLTAVFTKKY